MVVTTRTLACAVPPMSNNNAMMSFIRLLERVRAVRPDGRFQLQKGGAVHVLFFREAQLAVEPETRELGELAREAERAGIFTLYERARGRAQELAANSHEP